MPSIITNIAIGKVKQLSASEASSGIDKSLVEGPWIITQNGVTGDMQADLKRHGGPEKALHQYPREHYTSWLSEEPKHSALLAGPSAFGENISILGMNEKTVHIGDIYSFGTSILQVSQGRQPCWKLNLRFNCDDMAFRVQTTRRTGWYYRVLEEGGAKHGDELQLVERPQPEWPVHRLLEDIFGGCLDKVELSKISELKELAQSWKNLAAKRLETGVVEDWSNRIISPAING